jgi:putative PIG3 family NAD(P)H quinone oxidoreductase
MKAVVQLTPGGPETLKWGYAERPQIGDGEVLVRVAATAFNRADASQREGRYPPPAGASNILGLECSGVIEAVGSSVGDWAIGDRVCALLAGGGYAEFVAVPHEQLLPIPDGVGLLDAATLPEVACTVWSNLCMPARPRGGAVVLLHGGGGGIGTFAIQLMTTLGCRVVTTVGSTSGAALCRELGAEVVVDYRSEDFVEVVRDESLRGDRADVGADLILDIVGADYLQRNVDALAAGGRLTIIGSQSGVAAEVNLGSLMRKRGVITATTLRARPLDGAGSKSEIVSSVLENVWPFLVSGAIRTQVGNRLHVRDVAEAHRLQLSREAAPGKTLLIVDASLGPASQ